MKKDETAKIESGIRLATRKELLIMKYNTLHTMLINDEVDVFDWARTIKTMDDGKEKDATLDSKSRTEALMVQREQAMQYLLKEIEKEEKKEKSASKKAKK